MIKNNECETRNGPQGKFEFPEKIDGIPKVWNFEFMKINKETMKG